MNLMYIFSHYVRKVLRFISDFSVITMQQDFASFQTGEQPSGLRKLPRLVRLINLMV